MVLKSSRFLLPLGTTGAPIPHVVSIVHAVEPQNAISVLLVLVDQMTILSFDHHL